MLRRVTSEILWLWRLLAVVVSVAFYTLNAGWLFPQRGHRGRQQEKMLLLSLTFFECTFGVVETDSGTYEAIQKPVHCPLFCFTSLRLCVLAT